MFLLFSRIINLNVTSSAQQNMGRPSRAMRKLDTL